VYFSSQFFSRISDIHSVIMNQFFKSVKKMLNLLHGELDFVGEHKFTQ
jgi:hypothetical protein